MTVCLLLCDINFLQQDSYFVPVEEALAREMSFNTDTIQNVLVMICCKRNFVSLVFRLPNNYSGHSLLLSTGNVEHGRQEQENIQLGEVESVI